MGFKKKIGSQISNFLQLLQFEASVNCQDLGIFHVYVVRVYTPHTPSKTAPTYMQQMAYLYATNEESQTLYMYTESYFECRLQK